MNRTNILKALCMLSNAGTCILFWAEAASTACYLINRSPSTPLDNKTPIERTSVQVEHIEKKENDTAENNDGDHEP
jgi:hypothetical protein